MKSMTAFSSKQLQTEIGSFSWEIRSVNNRYLDMNFRLPEIFRGLEVELRNKMKQFIQRGKLDCVLHYHLKEEMNDTFSINEFYVQQLNKATAEIQKIFKRTRKVSPLEILRWPGVMQSVEKDLSSMKEQVLALFEEALHDLNQARMREGDQLIQIIDQKLKLVLEQVALVKKEMPQLVQLQRQSLMNRLEELKEELDQSRLEQEMVYYAQRADIAEEIDRLEAHIKEIQRILESAEPAGRRLDFLMQEMNREANTLGSKSLTEVTTSASVELKVLIEQIREQVQNIE